MLELFRLMLVQLLKQRNRRLNVALKRLLGLLNVELLPLFELIRWIVGIFLNRSHGGPILNHPENQKLIPTISAQKLFIRN